MAKVLGRADRGADAEPGERAQLLRYFDLLPRGWPMAAITRQADAGDAALNAWLRVDPVYVRPDMCGVRLMAWGNLGLSASETEALLQPLRPLFGDAGFPISAAAPERWFLAMPRESKFPALTAPADAMGDNLLAHLPEGPEGRRWRGLLNDAQIILHHHPMNEQRVAAGKLPVNSLWFWGAGVLPDFVSCKAACVLSEENELIALAKLARVPLTTQETGSTLVDLRGGRRWPSLESEQLESALASLKRRYASVLLDFADGAIFRIEPGQRWRLWRRAVAKLEG